MGTLWEQREWKQCFFHSFLFPFKNNIKFLTHKSQQHFTVPVKSSKLARKAPLSITTWNSLSHTLMGVQMFVQLEKLCFLHAVSHEHSNCELGGGPPSCALWTFTYCLSRCSLYLIFYIVSGDFFLNFSFLNENLFHAGQMFLHLEGGKPFQIVNTESHLKVTVKSFYVSLNVRLLINFPHWAPFRSWDMKMHGPGVIS